VWRCVLAHPVNAGGLKVSWAESQPFIFLEQNVIPWILLSIPCVQDQFVRIVWVYFWLISFQFVSWARTSMLKSDWGSFKIWPSQNFRVCAILLSLSQCVHGRPVASALESWASGSQWGGWHRAGGPFLTEAPATPWE